MAWTGCAAVMLFCCFARCAGVKQQVKGHRGYNGDVVQPWQGTSVQDLHREYSNIFKTGNRNAASHLWSTFLIDRARYMTDKEFRKFSKGYCAISGSPVSPGDGTRYKMTVERADGSGKQTGTMYYCCWPCVCDTWDFIKVDTKTIVTAEGPKEYNVAVIGNPCDKPHKLTEPFTDPFSGQQMTIESAGPEIRCVNGKLDGAIMSDHDHVIISLFFNEPPSSMRFQEGQDFDSMCEDRARNGYNSGMGEIFRQVAAISPIKPVGFVPFKQMDIKDMRQEAIERNVNLRRVVDRADLEARLAAARHSALHEFTTKALHTEVLRRGFTVQDSVEREELLQYLQDSMMKSGELPEQQSSEQAEKNVSESCDGMAPTEETL